MGKRITGILIIVWMAVIFAFSAQPAQQSSGMGATVMNGAVVGSNSLIAAGALVTEGAQIPEGSLVVGVPGKVRRALTAEEIASNREAAEGYAAVGHDLAEQGILYYGADLPGDIRTIALA